VNPTEVARKLGIGRSSVYRAMKERKIKRVIGVALAQGRLSAIRNED